MNNLVFQHNANRELIRRTDSMKDSVTLPKGWIPQSVKADATEIVYNFNGGSYGITSKH